MGRYEGSDLSAMSITWENICNYKCCVQPDITDIAKYDYGDYSELHANVKLRNNITVNNIAAFKLKDRDLFGLQHFMVAQTKLPVLPKPDPNQELNPTAIYIGIILYDGPGKYGPPKTSYEAVLSWVLNPWSDHYGNIEIALPGNQWKPVAYLEPDTEWHTLGVKADFKEMKYIFLQVELERIDISGYNLATKDHPKWDIDISAWVSCEAAHCDPGPNCQNRFRWYQLYRNWLWEFG